MHSVMSYSELSGLAFKALNISLIEKGKNWMKIKVEDENNQLVENNEFRIFWKGNLVNYSSIHYNNEFYTINFDSELEGQELLIIVYRSGYFSDSIMVFNLVISNGDTQYISGYLILIVIFTFIGIISIELSENHFKKVKKS